MEAAAAAAAGYGNPGTERERERASFLNTLKITVLLVHLASTSIVKYEANLCCHTCIEFRTVHGSDHGAQLPSSYKQKKLQLHVDLKQYLTGNSLKQSDIL